MAAAEVIIIGGGVIGLSSAVALAAAGYAPLLLAADGGEGAGASGCAPALLLPPTGRLAAARIGQAAHASWRLWPAWDAWLAALVGETPLLRMAGVTMRRGGTDRTVVGGWTPGAWHLTRLRDALQRHGGAVRRATATALRRTAAGVAVQCADGVALHAAVVIVAAGMGSGALAGAAPALRGQAGLALHLGGVTLDRPLCGDGVSLTPAADGRGVWATGDWAVDGAGATLPLWDAAAALHAQAAALLGRRGERQALLTGVRPRRCGGAPPITVGADAAGGGRVIAAVGHGRNGFLLAPLTALALLALLGAAGGPRGGAGGPGAARAPGGAPGRAGGAGGGARGPLGGPAAALDATAHLIGPAAGGGAPDAVGAGEPASAPITSPAHPGARRRRG
jgi:glycine oxidase